MLSLALVWLCSILAAESVLLLILIENDKPGWCTFSILSLFCLLKILFDINVLSLAWYHPSIAILTILVYFAIGTAWSICKWYLYVRNRREEYEKSKARWTPFASISRNARRVTSWETSHERGTFVNSKNGLAPLVRDNKSRVLTWMGYWPWSMLWTVVNDPVKKAFKFIYNRIYNALQAISNNAFKDAQ